MIDPTQPGADTFARFLQRLRKTIPNASRAILARLVPRFGMAWQPADPYHEEEQLLQALGAVERDWLTGEDTPPDP